MARIKLTRQWPDGDVLVIDVKAGDSYADALDEVRMVLLRTYREALDVTVDEAGEQ
jgi:hypothetical protein